MITGLLTWRLHGAGHGRALAIKLRAYGQGPSKISSPGRRLKCQDDSYARQSRPAPLLRLGAAAAAGALDRSAGGYEIPPRAELRAEVADGHLLSGETVTAIARCQACDDVVFSVEGDHPIWFAIVHLTWRRSREPVPWPATQPLRLPLAESLRAHTH